MLVTRSFALRSVRNILVLISVCLLGADTATAGGLEWLKNCGKMLRRAVVQSPQNTVAEVPTESPVALRDDAPIEPVIAAKVISPLEEIESQWDQLDLKRFRQLAKTIEEGEAKAELTRRFYQSHWKDITGDTRLSSVSFADFLPLVEKLTDDQSAEVSERFVKLAARRLSSRQIAAILSRIRDSAIRDRIASFYISLYLKENPLAAERSVPQLNFGEDSDILPRFVEAQVQTLSSDEVIKLQRTCGNSSIAESMGLFYLNTRSGDIDPDIANALLSEIAHQNSRIDQAVESFVIGKIKKMTPSQLDHLTRHVTTEMQTKLISLFLSKRWRKLSAFEFAALASLLPDEMREEALAHFAETNSRRLPQLSDALELIKHSDTYGATDRIVRAYLETDKLALLDSESLIAEMSEESRAELQLQRTAH